MKSFRLGFTALAVLLVMTGAPPAHAAESTAICSGTWQMSFSPGVSATPTKSAFTTNGETGTINCVGSLKGLQITGPGTFGQEGIFEGTCLQGTASSVITVTIPTSAGPEKLSFVDNMLTGPGFGFKFSDSLVGPMGFLFYPIVGNCVTAPVTQIAVVGQGVLKS